MGERGIEALLQRIHRLPTHDQHVHAIRDYVTAALQAEREKREEVVGWYSSAVRGRKEFRSAFRRERAAHTTTLNALRELVEAIDGWDLRNPSLAQRRYITRQTLHDELWKYIENLVHVSARARTLLGDDHAED